MRWRYRFCNIIQKDDAAFSEAFWVGGDSMEEQKLDRERESMSSIGVAKNGCFEVAREQKRMRIRFLLFHVRLKTLAGP